VNGSKRFPKGEFTWTAVFETGEMQGSAFFYCYYALAWVESSEKYPVDAITESAEEYLR